MRPEIITFLTFTQISDILTELRSTASIQQRDPAEYLEDENGVSDPETDATPPAETAPNE